MKAQRCASLTHLCAPADDESDLVRETANFLQALCVRAEEQVAAAGGCTAELLGCPSTSAQGPVCEREDQQP